MQQQELKSCPFCGKEFLDRWPCDFLDASGTNVVRCAGCHGAAPMAKWNTRAPARELDMSTKPGNLDTLAEHVHGIDAGVGGDGDMHDDLPLADLLYEAERIAKNQHKDGRYAAARILRILCHRLTAMLAAAPANGGG